MIYHGLKDGVIFKISRTSEVPANPAAKPPTDRVPPTQTTAATFQITSAKLYVPVVTLSINDNTKFLKNIKKGFKRTVSWNKYRSEITTHPKNNNLDYMIDPTFRNINRLFVLSFKLGRHYFSKYYLQLIEIKDFHVLIDNKPFFDQPMKNKQEVYEQLNEISRNDNYATGNLLNYLYYENIIIIIYWYKFIKANEYEYYSTN